MNTKRSSRTVKKTELSVVVPLYNEEKSLPELADEIHRVCRDAGISYEILFVDDGSTDGSFGVLESLHKKNSRVKAIQFRKNMGKADALAAGFGAASGARIVTLDADLQDDPAEIPRLLSKLDEGYDLVSGWKKKRRDRISRRILSRVYNRVTGWMTGIRLHDFNCGMKIYKREVVESISLYGELHRYIPVLAHWEGFRIGEMPVNHRRRKYGKTKYGFSRILRGPLDLITVLFLGEYTSRPLHLFGFLGLCSGLAGFGITLYLVFMRIFQKSFLSNRPLLFIGVLLIIVGVQFISFGLLGEMITRTMASNHTPPVRKRLGA